MNYRFAYSNMVKLIEDTLPERLAFLIGKRSKWYGKESLTDYENLVVAVKISIRYCYERGHGSLDYIEPLKNVLDAGRESLLVEYEPYECGKRTPCRKHGAYQRKRFTEVGYSGLHYWKKTSKSWKDQSKKRHQYE